MKEELYVEDDIVPLIAIPKSNKSKFRFLGTGFYVDKNGHLVTCRHVIDSRSEDERLFAYQIGQKKELELTIITKSDRYDLALCKSAPSGIALLGYLLTSHMLVLVAMWRCMDMYMSHLVRMNCHSGNVI